MTDPFGPARTLRVDGCDLHYWLVGAAGPVIVFTAGATADHRLFLPQVPAFSRRCRMLLWDVRGHGLSQPAGAPPTAQQAAADLAALLDHLGFDRVAYVGQSFGGMVGQALMIQQPGRIRAAVMLGSTSLTMPLSWGDRVGVAITPLTARLFPKPLFRRLGPANVAVTEGARAAFREMIDELSPAAINLIYAGLGNSLQPMPDYRLDLPLLICYGDQDGVGNIRRTAAVWAAYEPRAELALIPNAGHNANMDNPAYFNELALGFFSRILGTTHRPPTSAPARP